MMLQIGTGHVVNVVNVENRRYKSAITKLRCSAHRLKIEIGRYNRIRNEVTGKMDPPKRKTIMRHM